MNTINEFKKENVLLYTEKSIKNNFLILKNIQVNNQSYEFKILQEESTKNLLSPKLDYEGEQVVLKYDISGKVLLEDYIKNNKLNSKDLKLIIKSINEMLNEIENYLISENSILLDTKSIVIEKNNKKSSIRFVVIPDYQSDFSYELSKILIRLMRYIDVNDKETLALAYGLFIKSSKENFTINDLLDLCKDDYDDCDDLDLNDDFEYFINNKSNDNNLYEEYYDMMNKNVENEFDNKNINLNDDKADNNEVNDFYGKDDIIIDNDTKNVLFDSFDDDIEMIDKKDDSVEKVKDVSKDKKVNKQRLSVNVLMVKKMSVIVLLIAPIILSLLFGGMKFFYSNIMKIIFFEIFVVMFLVVNKFINRLFTINS